MPIVNPIEHLPRRPKTEGYPPSASNFVVEAFAEKWFDQYQAEGRDVKGLAIPEAGPYRGSMASMRCDRELYYALTDAERSNPPTIADYWRWWLGSIVHENAQPAVLDLFEGAAETKHDLRSIGIPGSSHSDLACVMEYDGEPTLVEIKTVNGFKYKMMATTFNGPPEGPSYGAVMQALLSAKAEGIDRVVIAILSLENLSPAIAKSLGGSEVARFASEWHYTVSEMETQIDAEIRRINLVMRHVEAGEKPERELHDPDYATGATVINPKGRPRAPWQALDGDVVVDTGDTWICNYCPWQETCAADD